MFLHFQGWSLQDEDLAWSYRLVARNVATRTHGRRVRGNGTQGESILTFINRFLRNVGMYLEDHQNLTVTTVKPQSVYISARVFRRKLYKSAVRNKYRGIKIGRKEEKHCSMKWKKRTEQDLNGDACCHTFLTVEHVEVKFFLTEYAATGTNLKELSSCYLCPESNPNYSAVQLVVYSL
jgi:hypothetical protein